nr:MAG TPA: hypothetical protein [Caudoviricetes sp.]
MWADLENDWIGLRTALEGKFNDDKRVLSA